MKRTVQERFVAVLKSKRFFYGVVLFFVLESAWIALSGRFPMAFDEDFHLGLIKLYAHQWSPFFAQQPDGANVYGAVIHNPSYLYHYIMSFPYRLVDGLFHDEGVTIAALRFLDIGFFTLGIVWFRKLFLRVNISAALAHSVVLFFVLTPLVPFLAAQINYDNLLMPLVPAALLLTLRFVRGLHRREVESQTLLLLLTVCMFASLVKYSFLPIFAAIVLFVGWELYRIRREVPVRQWLHLFWQRYMAGRRSIRVSLVAVFVLANGMFGSMYGYNVVKYHTPTPECDQVLNVRQCSAYGAWYRNYTFAMNRQHVDPSPLEFTVHWDDSYLYSLFSTVNGIYSGFVLGLALPVLHAASLVMFWVGLVLVAVYGRRLFAGRAQRLFGLAIVLYVLALWLNNYTDYLHLGEHVAEQGRYLIILLLPVYVLVAQAVSLALRRYPAVKPVTVAALVLIFTQGGGALTYIVHSNPSWWNENALVIRANHTAQTAIRPFLIGE